MNRIDQALDLLDLRDWIEQYTNVKSAGNEIRVQDCPMCGNDKWKLYINTEKRIWFCQRCAWGKNLGDICLLMAKISNRHINDIKLELASYVLPTPEAEEWVKQLGLSEPTREQEELAFEPVDLPGNLGLEGVMGSKAREYLINRGLSNQDIVDYKIRLAGKLRNISGPWAVFPLYYYSIPVAAQGRKFTSNNEPKYLSSDQIHKWVWPLDVDTINKTEESGEVTLVEGVFDAISYRKLGINSLCTFGKNLSTAQIKLLQTHKVHTLYLSYDADAHKDIKNIADRYGHVFHIKIVELPSLLDNPKADPGDVMNGSAPKEWLLEAHKEALSTQDSEYWNWKLRKELGL